MDTHMYAYLLRLAESATANVTLKRFLSSMSADMLSQMVPSSEAFTAVLALEHRHRTLGCNNCHSKNLNQHKKETCDSVSNDILIVFFLPSPISVTEY